MGEGGIPGPEDLPEPLGTTAEDQLSTSINCDFTLNYWVVSDKFIRHPQGISLFYCALQHLTNTILV